MEDYKYKNKMQKYILDSLYCTTYTAEEGEKVIIDYTDRQKIYYVFRHLLKECFHPYNLNKFNYNYRLILGDFLRGLPSYINIEFSNYEIIKLAKSWGVEFNEFYTEENYLDSYWLDAAEALILLFNKYGIDYNKKLRG